MDLTLELEMEMQLYFSRPEVIKRVLNQLDITKLRKVAYRDLEAINDLLPLLEKEWATHKSIQDAIWDAGMVENVIRFKNGS